MDNTAGNATNEPTAPPPQYPRPPQYPQQYPPAPPTDRGLRLLPIVGGAALIAVLLAATVIAFVVRSGGRGSPLSPTASPSSSVAATQADAGLVDLAEAPSVKYHGTIVNASGTRIPLDATVSNEGRTQATLTVNGEPVEVLATSERTFVKAGQGFWNKRATLPETIADYSGHWVQVAPDTFGVDLSTTLAPGVLARALDPGTAQRRPEIGDPTTVNGVQVRPVRTGRFTAYVTTARPNHVVQVTTDTTGPSATRTSAWTGSSGRTVLVRAPAAGGFTLDVTDQSQAETDQFLRTLRDRIRELATAIDSQVHFALSGAITLAPCSPNGCQANVTINNRVDLGSPYLKAQRQITATVTVDMTLDGRPVKTCVNTVTMPPNGSASTTCFAAYSIPPERNPTTHTVQAKARGTARAVVEADVQKMIDDLQKEQQRRAPPSASARPSPSKSDPCPDPFLDPNGETHVRLRHFEGGAQHGTNDSTWNPDVDLYELAEESARFEAKPQGNERCVRVAQAGRPIGTDRSRHLTSTYTVVQLKSGKVWTMHPGTPEE
jgi:hypothetical protein